MLVRHIACGLGLLMGLASAQTLSVEGAQALTYKRAAGIDLKLHVFKPADWRITDHRAAIVFFFGGGWTNGHPRQFAPHCRYLAARGMVAITAEYRVKQRGDATPYDCVEDAKSALRWVRQHADELGVDPWKIAAGGGSAGGHIAACTAVVTGFDQPDEDRRVSSRPDALVLFNPVTDTGPGNQSNRRFGVRSAEVSPVVQVSPDAPPCILFHGTADRPVPVAQAVAFQRAMNRVGVRCDLQLYSGRGHGFFNHRPGTMRDYISTVRYMDRFLSSLGWIQGPPTIAPEGAASWHGYTRRDSDLQGRRLIVVEPDQPAEGRPWIWRARFFGHEPQTDVALLSQGFHLVYVDVADLYGNAEAIAAWDACYNHVTKSLGLSPKPALECMSRGGLIAYRWAARHPERVACIYADAPVCDIKSWPGGKGTGKGHQGSWRRCLEAHGVTETAAMQWRENPIDVLAPIAEARVPLLHVVGADDEVVPVAENTTVLARRYRALGGRIRVISKPGIGHHPHSLVDPSAIVEFIQRHTTGSGDWFSLRGGLDRSRRRFEAGGDARVAFLGGSITHNSGWRDQVGDDLMRRFPKTRFSFVNAGIPSFGSTPGAFRLSRDVFANGQVDLLFIEAAVNDSTNGRSREEMIRGMEGIVRHARRRSPRTDMVMLQFVDPDKVAQLDGGAIPAVIAAHEQVARRYAVPSVNLALEVTERIQGGDFTWKGDFKDLHPSPFGQKLYADAVSRMFDTAWRTPSSEAAPGPHPLPAPLDRGSYAGGVMVPLSAADLSEGWTLTPSWTPTDGKGTRPGFVRVPMLVTTTPGAAATLSFEGTAVGVLVTAGPDAGVIESRVDGGPWRRTDLLTRWSGRLHLPWSHVLHAGLSPGSHRMELRFAAQQPDRPGKAAARLAWFLVNQGRRP